MPLQLPVQVLHLPLGVRQIPSRTFPFDLVVVDVGSVICVPRFFVLQIDYGVVWCLVFDYDLVGCRIAYLT